ncbi:flagellar biosynthesis repressor FlbT [Pelagibacterium luteolum]|uniref:Protein FlbT n=1 Tax=Pelagibacterium luteolum TaxID=440168 RepID=A0A1G8AJC7_9HYPH|nr:flagellar biosynthesis repressor FlbT [Pelagibacterium luteolum]SDH21028.1 protein FlbT [Pelagibacterium luteolum]
MALKINLKDGDSVYFGTSKVTAVQDGGYIVLVVDGADLPIMRASEVISLEHADTAYKRIYYHLQQYYLERSPEQLEIAEAFAGSLNDEERDVVLSVILQVAKGQTFKGLRLMRGIAGIRSEN